MVRKLVVSLGLLSVLLIGAIWAPLNFRNSGPDLAAETETVTISVADEAPPEPPKIEDHPAAQSFTLFSAVYQAASDAKELAKFEKDVTGLPVIWIGKITDVPNTGEHLVVAPLVSAANAGFDAFVVAKLDDPALKLADIAKAGNLIMLEGTITSFGTNGPIVTVSRFAIGTEKNDEAKVE